MPGYSWVLPLSYPIAQRRVVPGSVTPRTEAVDITKINKNVSNIIKNERLMFKSSVPNLVC